MAITAQKPASSGSVASKGLFADRVVDDLTSLDSRTTSLEGKTAPTPVQVKDSSFATGTTSSTTYTSALTGLASLSTTFTVPPSGKVYVNIAAAVINNVASGPWDFFASFQITGAATYGPNDTDAVHTRNGSANFGGVSSRRVLVTGLTPGTSPTVTMVYKVSSSTGAYGIRSILVEPVMS